MTTTTVPGIEAYDYELDPHPANKLDQWEFTDSAWFAAQRFEKRRVWNGVFFF